MSTEVVLSVWLEADNLCRLQRASRFVGCRSNTRMSREGGPRDGSEELGAEYLECKSPARRAPVVHRQSKGLGAGRDSRIQDNDTDRFGATQVVVDIRTLEGIS